MPAEVHTQATGHVSHGQSPATASHQEVLLAAYEGFWELRAAGKSVDVEEYCNQYPELRSSLPNLLRACTFVEDHQSKLAELGATDFDNDWPQPGDTFLDFELRRELGRGGFSRVYLATQAALGNRWVAVKLYKKPMREARILGPLNHPNIVPINSLQVDAGRRMAAICMPYAGSATLQRLLDLIGKDGVPARAKCLLRAAEDTAAPPQLKEQMGLPAPAEVLQRGSYIDGVCHIGLQLADALAFIHKRRIFHRDLKPSNVLLKPDGQPMLLDFNLSDEADKPMARMGGTLPYMSPEQLQAWWQCHQDAERMKASLTAEGVSADHTVQTESRQPQVAAPADLYSLGVMLYELLTGVHPFGPIPVKVSVQDLYHLIHDRQQRGFRPLRELNPKVDQQLAALVQRCLAVSAGARPESAEAVANELRECLEKGRRSRVRRNRWIIAAACVFFMTAGAAGAFIGHFFRGDAETQLRAAVAHAKKGEHHLAIDITTSVLTDDPDNAEARFLRGRLYQWLGQTERKDITNALSDYAQLERIKPDGRGYAALGYCKQSMNQISWPGAAIECYVKAIKEKYDSAVLRNNLGRCYQVDGQHEKAKEQYDAALAKNPELQVALLNRATNSLNLFFRSKDERHLYNGMLDVAAGLKLGETAELYAAGALLHGVAARTHPEEIERGLFCYANARRLGNTTLKATDNSLQALRGAPGWQKVIEQKAEKNHPSAVLFLDPVKPGDSPI